MFRDVVAAIVESANWKDAFRNQFTSPSGLRLTPIRLLIKKFPDMARMVFDKCITTNMHSNAGNSNSNMGSSKTSNKTVSPDDANLVVTMDYELIDDAYSIFQNETDDDDSDTVSYIEELEEVWDENGKLLPSAKPYSNSGEVIKLNHPLMIMVQEKRTVNYLFNYWSLQ